MLPYPPLLLFCHHMFQGFKLDEMDIGDLPKGIDAMHILSFPYL